MHCRVFSNPQSGIKFSRDQSGCMGPNMASMCQIFQMAKSTSIGPTDPSTMGSGEMANLMAEGYLCPHQVCLHCYHDYCHQCCNKYWNYCHLRKWVQVVAVGLHKLYMRSASAAMLTCSFDGCSIRHVSCQKRWSMVLNSAVVHLKRVCHPVA